jgi:hypothetical protein
MNDEKKIHPPVQEESITFNKSESIRINLEYLIEQFRIEKDKLTPRSEHKKQNEFILEFEKPYLKFGETFPNF